jgi:hypothetical protein
MKPRNANATPLDPTNPDHFADLIITLGMTEAWEMRIAHLKKQLTRNPYNADLQQQLATAKHARDWAMNI